MNIKTIATCPECLRPLEMDDATAAILCDKLADARVSLEAIANRLTQCRTADVHVRLATDMAKTAKRRTE